MGVVETLTGRNADFAKTQFTEGLRMMPALKTIVIGCVDPRVDPEAVLGAEPGEIATIRNVGGRVTPRTLEEMMMLRKVTQAAGGDLGLGWEVIVLQHRTAASLSWRTSPTCSPPTSRPTSRAWPSRRSATRAPPLPTTSPLCAPRPGWKGYVSPGSSTTWPRARSDRRRAVAAPGPGEGDPPARPPQSPTLPGRARQPANHLETS